MRSIGPPRFQPVTTQRPLLHRQVAESPSLRFQGRSIPAGTADEAWIGRELAPAVVRILTPGGMGTGFFYQPRDSERLRLVTAAHVVMAVAQVEEPGQPRLAFQIQLPDGRRLPVCLAETPDGLLAFDGTSDLAVLEVLGPLPAGLKPLRFRDFRGDPPRRTEDIFMVGRSVGRPSMRLSDSLSRGVILSDFMVIETGFSPMNQGQGRAAMKTSLRGLPGDSGSPVFDKDGLVIGVFVREGTPMRGEQVLTSLFQMGHGPADLVKRDKPPRPTLRQRLARLFRKHSE